MKPLTIEQLKGLKTGDWVWVDHTCIKSYVKILKIGEEYFTGVDPVFDTLYYWYSDYGTKWVAYKNKEQAEAKGEIVELPCKIGDTVWYIEYGYCYPNLKSKLEAKPIIVTEISWKQNRSGKDMGFALIANGTRYKFSSIGKTVFFTKSEAEKRIAKLKGEKK